MIKAQNTVRLRYTDSNGNYQWSDMTLSDEGGYPNGILIKIEGYEGELYVNSNDLLAEVENCLNNADGK